MRLTTKFLARFAGLLMGTAFGSQINPVVAQSLSDEQAWRAASTAGTLQAYESYLSQYPDGSFARDAFRCVVELSIDLPRSACRIEPAAGASVADGGSSAVRGIVDVY